MLTCLKHIVGTCLLWPLLMAIMVPVLQCNACGQGLEFTETSWDQTVDSESTPLIKQEWIIVNN